MSLNTQYTIFFKKKKKKKFYFQRNFRKYSQYVLK